MTDSFQLPFFVAQIVTPGDDIYYTNSFVAYQNGRFKQLFTIELDAREKGIELHRVGSELRGLMAGRDEVVDNLEWDYPVTVLLPIPWQSPATSGGLDDDRGEDGNIRTRSLATTEH